MPEFYTWVILLINQQDEMGKNQLSVFGSRGGQNSPLMHVPLSYGDSIGWGKESLFNGPKSHYQDCHQDHIR